MTFEEAVARFLALDTPTAADAIDLRRAAIRAGQPGREVMAACWQESGYALQHLVAELTSREPSISDQPVSEMPSPYPHVDRSRSRDGEQRWSDQRPQQTLPTNDERRLVATQSDGVKHAFASLMRRDVRDEHALSRAVAEGLAQLEKESAEREAASAQRVHAWESELDVRRQELADLRYEVAVMREERDELRSLDDLEQHTATLRVDLEELQIKTRDLSDLDDLERRRSQLVEAVEEVIEALERSQRLTERLRREPEERRALARRLRRAI